MSEDRVETIEATEQQDEFTVEDLETNREIKGGSLDIKATDVTLKRGIID